MTNQIQQILNDLYALDPEFRKQEKELVKIIESLLRSKPEARVDENFIERLKEALYTRLETQTNIQQTKPSVTETVKTLFSMPGSRNLASTKLAEMLKRFFNKLTFTKSSNKEQFEILKQNFTAKFSLPGMNKLFYAVAGAALALIIAIPLATKNNKLSIGTEEIGDSLGLAPMSSRYGSQAFGKLSAGDVSSLSVRNQSGGGGFGLGAGSVAPMALLDSSTPVSEKMIVPPMQNYTFTYAGEAYPLEQDSLEVLRKEKGANSNLGQVLANMNLGLIDLKKFSDGKLQNFTIVQDREYGYMIYVDLNEGTIFVSQNWQRWPQVRCQDESCWARYRVKPEELPSDQELIAIADKFLKDFGISTAGYGKPEVEKGFLRDYELMADKSMYFLDQISVRYPQQIDGKTVYELQGDPAGMVVTVMPKERRATGVSGITTKSYSRSAYPAVKDFDRVKKIAERGGMSPLYYYGRESQDGANKIELKLGNPEMVFARNFQYRDNQSIELLVPALRFPIEDSVEKGYYQKNVIVPIASEILDDWERNFSGGTGGTGPITIMDAPVLKESK